MKLQECGLGVNHPVNVSQTVYIYYIFVTNNINQIPISPCMHSTVVDCGTLDDPDNGQVNHTAGTTFQQTATYSCTTGHNLTGDSTRTCQDNGVWSGSEPTCQSEQSLL